ncbi:MAG: DMT family transporter [Clostridia bacterium]|nr:DMT family transporter [Clostridia bacterium]
MLTIQNKSNNLLTNQVICAINAHGRICVFRSPAGPTDQKSYEERQRCLLTEPIRKLKGLTNHIFVLAPALVLLWGSFAAVSKLALSSLDAFQLQFYMFGLACVALTILLLINGRLGELRRISKKDILRLVLISVPSYLYYFLYTLSLKLLPAVEASSLNYIFPIMIVLFAIPIQHEKLSLLKSVSILAGFLGTLIILTNGNILRFKMTNLAGDLLAIAGAASWGIFSNYLKKNRVDMMLSNYIFALTAFAFSAVSMSVFSRFRLPTGATFAQVLWISLSNIVVSYFVWNRLLKKCSSSLSASISFLTPFATLLFIMWLLGERITPAQLAGLAVIVTGIFLCSVSEIYTGKKSGKALPKKAGPR